MKNMILMVLCIFTFPAIGQVNYTYYSKSEVEQDMDDAFEKLTSIHPIFLDNEVLADYQNKFSILKESLKDSMTQNDVYLVLAPLFASLNDGHTGILAPTNDRSQYNKAGGKAFPFFVTIKKDSMYVSFYCGNDSTLFRGGEQILEINGIEAIKMVHDMQMLYGGKSIANKQKAIADKFRFLIWMCYGFDENYELTIKNYQQEIHKMTIPGITSDEFMHNLKRRPHQNKEYFEFSIQKGKNLAIMKIGTFGDLEGFCNFADSAFAEIKNHKVENLVIDIRNNGGGRSIVVDSLMNYITDKEYAQYQKIEIRISPELKERYKERYPNRFDWINSYAINDLFVPEYVFTKPQNNNARFKGNLILLTSNTSYSAAATFAGLFKELKFGTIIGEETGGTISYYGDFWYMKTVNTGITFYVSPKHFIQYGGADLMRGVFPDYYVEDEEDSIMDFTLERIEENDNQ
ncbi:MAG: hypothetical protein KKF98_07230 [Bacteroidetes bacterium]|nr:hypothetical protein [Bacteroidota bacterium]